MYIFLFVMEYIINCEYTFVVNRLWNWLLLCKIKKRNWKKSKLNKMKTGENAKLNGIKQRSNINETEKKQKNPKGKHFFFLYTLIPSSLTNSYPCIAYIYVFIYHKILTVFTLNLLLSLFCFSFIVVRW